MAAIDSALDSQIQADLVTADGFAADQLSELATLALDLIRSPKHSNFQERLGEFAQAHSVNVGALKNVSRGLIIFFREAMKRGWNGQQISTECSNIGMSEASTNALRGIWETNFASLANVQVSKTIMVNQLVDMEWKFGVTAASSELQQVGSTFLHMKLVIDRGNGKREDVHMELSLPEFYEFMADMEKAKSFMDFLSN